MPAVPFAAGAWSFMAHGMFLVQGDVQGGPRGTSQLNALNWGMLAASRRAAGGRLELRAMLSAEPFTMSAHGYPLLLQTGEAYRGLPLTDHQHPHDLFMELAVLYEHRIVRSLAGFIYLAPVGDPALGPPAYPHRPSASGDPLAPLTHHWEDGAHITFGAMTAGLFTRWLKVEASVFNGREPDEHRTNFDYAGRRLDSYSGRLTVNPKPTWSVSAWYAYLKNPEQLPPQESVHRLGAAALVTRGLGTRGTWSIAAIYAANVQVGSGRSASSATLESTTELDGRNTVFGRVEFVQKSALDLNIPPPIIFVDLGALPTGVPRPELHIGRPDPVTGRIPPLYKIEGLTLGVVRELHDVGPLHLGVGLLGSVTFVPHDLRAIYGSSGPKGASVYVSLRPGAASRHDMGRMNTRRDAP